MPIFTEIHIGCSHEVNEIINIWSLPRLFIFPPCLQFWAVVASVTFHWKSVQGSSIVLNKGGKGMPPWSTIVFVVPPFLFWILVSVNFFDLLLPFQAINTTILNIYNLNSKSTITPERFSSSSIGHGLEISLSFVSSLSIFYMSKKKSNAFYTVLIFYPANIILLHFSWCDKNSIQSILRGHL